MLRGWAMVVVVFAAAAAADVVVLRSGDRIEGRIERETDDAVYVKRVYGEGGIRFVERIARRHIVRIERTDEPLKTQPAAPTTPVSTTQPAGRPMSSQEKESLLTAAIERWRKDQYTIAGACLSRLIGQANPSELAAWSERTERELEMSLADLAAEAHLRAAAPPGRNRPIRLKLITEYEKPSLAARLERAYEEAIREEIVVTARRASRQRPPREVVPDRTPVATTQESAPPRQATIAAWLSRPDDYDGDRAEAEELTERVHYARSLLTERMRLDARVRQDSAMKDRLTTESDRLTALLKAAAARAQGAMTPKELAAVAEERKRREEEYRRWLDEQQKLQEQYMQQAIKGARQEEQDDRLKTD